MENISKTPNRKTKSTDLRALKVMKTLSMLTKEELKGSAPLTITIVNNKVARIVKSSAMSEVSTDSE